MTVGIFVLIAVCSLIWLIFKFGDLPVFVGEWKSYMVKVQFPMATGVQENTPVRFCGYQIGRVTDIRPPVVMKEVNGDHYYHQTLVILSIDKKYNDIPADVEVKLMTRGLSSSYIELKLRSFDVNESPGGYLTNGSLLQGSTGMTSEFFPEESQKKLEELVNGLSTFIDNANEILGDKANKENIKTTLANLSGVSKQATQTLDELQKFLAAGVNASEEASKTAAELRLILEKINNGQGTAAKFINDARLYENLLENTQQFELLLQDLENFVAEYRTKGIKLKLQ
jgi:phospholipid/cholesterol/gamma-HCH transport system substrate-binding protein